MDCNGLFFSASFSEFKTSNHIKLLCKNFNFITLYENLNSSSCLSGLELGVKTVCTVKIDGKQTRFVDYFIFQRAKTKCSLACHIARVKLLATFPNQF